MSLIAVAVKHLLAAGVTGDALVTAIAEMEAVKAEAGPVRSSGAERQARYRRRRRETPRLDERDWLPLRGAVVRRDGACQYCGATDDLTADHVLPLSRGGTNDLDNLVAACRSCNASKGGRTVEEWRSGTGPRHGDASLRNGDAPFLPSEVSPHTPLPTNQPIQVPPYSPPKARRAKQPETLDADVERVAEQVWAAASQTARDRSSRKENRKAVAAALGQGATAESLTASVRRLCDAKGEFANGVHILVSGEHWRDEQAPAQAAEPDPWPNRLSIWNRDRHWRETWGPPPDKPGYRGPEPQQAAA